MANRYRCTVYLLIEADTQGAASDALLGLLTEHMQEFEPESALIDWRFIEAPQGVICHPEKTTDTEA